MKKETEIEPIHYWTMAFYFFNLSCLSIEQLIKCENAFILISKSPMTTTQIDEATKWSDSQIGIPILFNFYHAIELILKGFYLATKNKRIPATHKLTRLVNELTCEDIKTEIDLIRIFVTEIDQNSPLAKFLASNQISIDDWYEALKYPESKNGDQFFHINLKYGGPQTIKFWESLLQGAENIRRSTVAFEGRRSPTQ